MTMHHEAVKREPGEYIVEEHGSRRSLQVYPCGCEAVYCLCGCDNAPEIRDCKLHRAAEELLTAAREQLEALERGDGSPVAAHALILRIKTAQQGDR